MSVPEKTKLMDTFWKFAKKTAAGGMTAAVLATSLGSASAGQDQNITEPVGGDVTEAATIVQPDPVHFSKDEANAIWDEYLSDGGYSALSEADSTTPEVTDLQPEKQPTVDRISLDSSSGLLIQAASSGQLQINGSGNAHHGDPLAGTTIMVDLEKGTLDISSKATGSTITHTLNLQGTDIDPHQDLRGADTGVSFPSLSDMNELKNANDGETGLYTLEDGNLKATIYDSGDISDSNVLVEYDNPDTGDTVTVFTDGQNAFVHVKAEDGTAKASTINLDTTTPTQTVIAPKAKGPGMG